MHLKKHMQAVQYLKDSGCRVYFYGLATCIWTKYNNTLASRHFGFIFAIP